VEHLAAALRLVPRRYVRWSALGLVVMFGLFVLLMDFPGAVRHPTARLSWILTARETTFAMGGLALLATETRRRRPAGSRMLITIARVWTAAVLVFYGIEHFLHPELSPGVPDTRLTASWVPLPLEVAVATGILLVASGAAMLIGRYARAGAALGGFLMLLLTLALYVPEFVRAANVADHVNALNFIFDTLLFAGMVLMVGRAIVSTGSRPESPTGV
jgi:uncharacterized membrane protein YphA (DoxX/SURF4 family)